MRMCLVCSLSMLPTTHTVCLAGCVSLVCHLVHHCCLSLLVCEVVCVRLLVCEVVRVRWCVWALYMYI